MEDIEKRVKELRKFCDKNLIDGKINFGLMLQDLENLIKRNKELEENIKKYERANDYLLTLNHKYYEDNVILLRKNGKVDILADNIHFKYIDMVENYIPKSKVIEKIEEVNNSKENYIFERLTSEDIRRTIVTNLQELLKERN